MRKEYFDPIKHRQEKEQVAKELLDIGIQTKWDKENKELRIDIPYEDNTATIYDTGLTGHIEKLKDNKVAGTEDDTFFYIDDIRVHPRARRMGIGLLLVEKLHKELEKADIKHIFGVAESGEVLALFAKVFGKQGLIFYKSEYRPTEIGRCGQETDQYENMGSYIDFGVNLSKIKT